LLHNGCLDKKDNLCFNVYLSSCKQDNKTIAIKQEASKKSYKVLVAAAIKKDTNTINSS